MLKTVVMVALLSFTSVFANDSVRSVISEIEFDKNAKCEFVKSSSSFCLSFLCFSKKTYTCTSNQSDFLVEIKVKQSTVNGNYSKVRSVKIID